MAETGTLWQRFCDGGHHPSVLRLYRAFDLVILDELMLFPRPAYAKDGPERPSEGKLSIWCHPTEELIGGDKGARCTAFISARHHGFPSQNKDSAPRWCHWGESRRQGGVDRALIRNFADPGGEVVAVRPLRGHGPTPDGIAQDTGWPVDYLCRRSYAKRDPQVQEADP